jgi:hypothetical protein
MWFVMDEEPANICYTIAQGQASGSLSLDCYTLLQGQASGMDWTLHTDL